MTLPIPISFLISVSFVVLTTNLSSFFLDIKPSFIL